MKKRHVFLCVLTALALLTIPSISRADDGVTLTLDTANLTVTEGNTLSVFFTLTNDTGSDIATNNTEGGAAFFTGTGDPSDSFINSVFGQGNCRFITLAAGDSCTFQLITLPKAG